MKKEWREEQRDGEKKRLSQFFCIKLIIYIESRLISLISFMLVIFPRMVFAQILNFC